MSSSDELVSQFLAITGSADVERALSYIEMSGGHLETAIALYMEHSPSSSGGGFDSATGTTSSNMSPNIRAPDATRTMRLMDHMDYDDDDDDDDDPQNRIAMLINRQLQQQQPYQRLADTTSAFAASDQIRAAINAAAAAALAGNDSEESTPALAHLMPPTSNTLSSLHTSTTTTGGGGLQDMFAPPTHLLHTAGGFQGARNVAKDARRWLLVNIQRDSEFSSHVLNRDVWRDELVENLLREGFIFWQAMDTSPDGMTYSQRYQVMDYPHVAILDPRTGRLMWRKEGWTQEHPLTAESFAEMAMDFCSRHSFDKPPVAPKMQLSNKNGATTPTTSNNASTKQGRKRVLTEQEQLQAAMRASLKRDDDEDDDDDDDEPYGMDSDDDDDDVDVDDDSEVEYLKTEMQLPQAPQEVEVVPPPEPSPLQQWIAMPVGDEPPDGARIQTRMPDGKRLIRKFDKQGTVKTIYAFVAQSNEEARGGREFSLMAGFPPKDLVDDIDSTIDACGLAGQAISVRWKE